jgi:hypothetical protein
VISGVFILRGQDIKGVIDVAPDWESYKYKKLDLGDEAQKTLFEAALAWDLEIDGKKWADGKNVRSLGLRTTALHESDGSLLLVQVMACALMPRTRVAISFSVLSYLVVVARLIVLGANKTV